MMWITKRFLLEVKWPFSNDLISPKGQYSNNIFWLHYLCNILIKTCGFNWYLIISKGNTRPWNLWIVQFGIKKVKSWFKKRQFSQYKLPLQAVHHGYSQSRDSWPFKNIGYVLYLWLVPVNPSIPQTSHRNQDKYILMKIFFYIIYSCPSYYLGEKIGCFI